MKKLKKKMSDTIGSMRQGETKTNEDNQKMMTLSPQPPNSDGSRSAPWLEAEMQWFKSQLNEMKFFQQARMNEITSLMKQLMAQKKDVRDEVNNSATTDPILSAATSDVTLPHINATAAPPLISVDDTESMADSPVASSIPGDVVDGFLTSSVLITMIGPKTIYPCLLQLRPKIPVIILPIDPMKNGETRTTRDLKTNCQKMIK